MLAERQRGGSPCRTVRAIAGARLAHLDAEIAALMALRSELVTMLDEWDEKLSATPPHQQARLLDRLITT